MVIILVTLLAFVIPVVIYLFWEWKKKKEQEKKEGFVPKKKEPVDARAVAKVTALFVILAIPVLLLSSAPYSFYSGRESVVKVGFKHTGKRVADCGDELDIIRKEGERYRRDLKSTRQVAMDVAKLANCPRERHPVYLKVVIDGKEVINNAYSPTGLKKDMASYIYEEFSIGPGLHEFSVSLHDQGRKDTPDHTLQAAVTMGAGEIKVLRFNDKTDALVIE